MLANMNITSMKSYKKKLHIHMYICIYKEKEMWGTLKEAALEDIFKRK